MYCSVVLIAWGKLGYSTIKQWWQAQAVKLGQNLLKQPFSEPSFIEGRNAGTTLSAWIADLFSMGLKLRSIYITVRNPCLNPHPEKDTFTPNTCMFSTSHWVTPWQKKQNTLFMCILAAQLPDQRSNLCPPALGSAAAVTVPSGSPHGVTLTKRFPL